MLVGGSLHIVVLSGVNNVHHSVRLPNGSWTALHSVEAFAGDLSDLVDVAAAGFTTGELQVVALAASGAIWHAARYTDGRWSSWGDVRGYAGNPGLATRVSLAAGWRS